MRKENQGVVRVLTKTFRYRQLPSCRWIISIGADCGFMARSRGQTHEVVAGGLAGRTGAERVMLMTPRSGCWGGSGRLNLRRYVGLSPHGDAESETYGPREDPCMESSVLEETTIAHVLHPLDEIEVMITSFTVLC